MAQAKDKSKRPPKAPQKKGHDKGRQMMKDSEMEMTPELKNRYPSMFKKGKRGK